MDSGIKNQLTLDNLSCAHCAIKIEDEINKLENFKASLNFTTKTLTIETTSKLSESEVFSKANAIIQRIEPGVIVTKANAINQIKSIETQNVNKSELIILGSGSVLFFLGIAFKLPFYMEFTLFMASYLLVGWEVLIKAVKNIARGEVFDENFLMCIATIGAFAIGEFPEGVAVMLFYQIGELFQDIAINNSRKSISRLMDIRPDYANIKKGDGFLKVSPEKVVEGDIIIIKPGEKVPLDGKVIQGSSMLDTSAITGESMPRDVEEGSEIMSGSINKNGLLTIVVTKRYGESTVSKILDLVQNASSKKAQTEQFITKFARYYTPAVVITALSLAFIPMLILPGVSFSTWLYRALVFLVVSCPCALVVSIPLGFFGGIGGAAKRGILLKGGNYLEALNNVDTVIFDKTGTLTKGIFKVSKVVSTGKISAEELLKYVAHAEFYSNHPIAQSIKLAYGAINLDKIKEYEEQSGHGTKIKFDEKEILAGNLKLMQKYGIKVTDTVDFGTIVYIAIDKNYEGYIVISDEIKDDSRKAIVQLRALGVKKIVMLTGDSSVVGNKIAQELSIDEVHSELLPHHKVEILEFIEKNKTTKGKIIFVGDGINDAPVLTRADVGIAMGGVGSDAAIEAADVVIMTDEPSKIADAIKISKFTKKIVWQNIIFAMTVKGIVLLLGAGGIATMWEAVFADVGVALLAVLNATRVLRK